MYKNKTNKKTATQKQLVGTDFKKEKKKGRDEQSTRTVTPPPPPPTMGSKSRGSVDLARMQPSPVSQCQGPQVSHHLSVSARVRKSAITCQSVPGSASQPSPVSQCQGPQVSHHLSVSARVHKSAESTVGGQKESAALSHSAPVGFQRQVERDLHGVHGRRLDG